MGFVVAINSDAGVQGLPCEGVYGQGKPCTPIAKGGKLWVNIQPPLGARVSCPHGAGETPALPGGEVNAYNFGWFPSSGLGTLILQIPAWPFFGKPELQ